MMRRHVTCGACVTIGADRGVLRAAARLIDAATDHPDSAFGALVMRNGACMVRADDDRHRGLRLLLVGWAGPGAVTERMYVGVCPRGAWTTMAVTCGFAYLAASREE